MVELIVSINLKSFGVIAAYAEKMLLIFKSVSLHPKIVVPWIYNLDIYWILRIKCGNITKIVLKCIFVFS